VGTERWVKKVQFIIHEENDGAAFLRHGSQKTETTVDGSDRTALMIKPDDLADSLKRQLGDWPAGWWDKLIEEIKKRP